MFQSPFLSVQIFSSFTLIADIVFFILLFFLLCGEGSWREKLFSHLSAYAFHYGLAIALMGALGSLFFSNIIGFTPCELCWFQRVFLFPQILIFGIALWKKDTTALYYSLGLSLIGISLALYQSYVQWGGFSVLPCTADGAECSKIFFKEFGYITIPVMSLTSFSYLILLICVRMRRVGNKS